MRLMVCAITLVVVAGCATSSPRPAATGTRFWLVPSPEASELAQHNGMRLSLPDNSTVVIPGPVVQNLLAARKSIEEASGISAQLAVVDMNVPNAFATSRSGSPMIAISLPWLDALGADRDAIATTLGHEYAHVKLGHNGQARKEREQAAATGSQVIGGILNAFVPFSGNLAGMAITGVTRGFTRDEERAADELGMKWAADAGYNPCGRIRTMRLYQQAIAGSSGFSFLSTHPGADERIEYARTIAQQRGQPCG